MDSNTPIGARVGLSRRRLISVTLASAVSALGGVGSRSVGMARVAAHDQIDIRANESRRYFARTGHNLSEPFLARWQEIGGEEVVGAPISEERYAEGAGGVLQSFEGITLLYDPAQAAPNDVQGQPLDPAILEAVAPPAAKRRVPGCSGADATCRFFPEAGHTLSGTLRAFWESSGGEPIFGRPFSEPFEEVVDGLDITVQIFATVVLEDRGSEGIRLRTAAPVRSGTGEPATDPAFRPTPPNGGTTFLVGAGDGLRLRSGPSVNAEMAALLPENAEFIAATLSDGD